MLKKKRATEWQAATLIFGHLFLFSHRPPTLLEPALLKARQESHDPVVAGIY